LILTNKSSVYAMKLTTFFAGIETAQSDLKYLEHFVKEPDKKFEIKNILDFCLAVTALSTQIDYMTINLANNNLSEDGRLLYLSEEQLNTLSLYSDLATSAVEKMSNSCGIDMEVH
jgi:hypothetical protein